MKHIAPRFDRATALRLIYTRRGFLRRLFRPLPACQGLAGEKGVLPYLEIVYMPYYVATFEFESASVDDVISVCVDGCGGAFSLFQGETRVTEGVPDGQFFPPVLREDEAILLARKGLLAALLQQRGQSRRPVPKSIQSVVLLHWPLWVYYYHRWRGCLDVILIDAATGERLGGRAKSSVLNAFTSAPATNSTSL